MDPCPFVRILVGNLALKFPAASRSFISSSSSCFCKIKLKNFPTQEATIPLLHLQQQEKIQNRDSNCISNSLAACFNLDKTQIEKISSSKKPKSLTIEIYTGGDGAVCGWTDRKLLGKVIVPLNLKRAESRPHVMHNGWIAIGQGSKKGSSMAEFYLSVRAEPDPRYVFQFGGEPECSPQVFQVQGNVKQPVFTCKFSLRNPGDRNLGSRFVFLISVSWFSHLNFPGNIWIWNLCINGVFLVFYRQSTSEPTTSRNWLSSMGAEKDQSAKERKGWTITVHDLSGSPVAMASMVTPFVASPGSGQVSRSNPGDWLILRPSLGAWKSWGRLAAWREHDNVGYRFELIHDTVTATPTTTTLINSVVSTKNGEKGQSRFRVQPESWVETAVHQF